MRVLYRIREEVPHGSEHAGEWEESFPRGADAEHFAQEGVGGLEIFVLEFDAFEEAFGVGAALA